MAAESSCFSWQRSVRPSRVDETGRRAAGAGACSAGHNGHPQKERLQAPACMLAVLSFGQGLCRPAHLSTGQVLHWIPVTRPVASPAARRQVRRCHRWLCPRRKSWCTQRFRGHALARRGELPARFVVLDPDFGTPSGASNALCMRLGCSCAPSASSGMQSSAGTMQQHGSALRRAGSGACATRSEVPDTVPSATFPSTLNSSPSSSAHGPP
jgi:hypothetical protein